jgi:hypothetical protein
MGMSQRYKINMRKELRDRLWEKYPVLYSEIYNPKMILNCEIPNEGFYCGDGWYTLLDTLSELIFERDPAAVISQVTKDSGGKLQVCMSIYNVDEDHDYIYSLCGTANSISKIICEKCSKYAPTCIEHPERQNKNVRQLNKIELPRKFKETGKIWHEMSRIFYESVFHCIKACDLPTVNFDRIESKKGKLEIEISGGTEPFEAGLYLLLTYANKIDPNTGEAKLLR